ncbi:hypothetical protein SLS62_002466 [Diatrype stigma]|uniref:Methyltransferase type 11 domain-containing protein n=1 Tax=Diatrype stigma TaxID=117547 RepID=A0AAN9UYB1_9PEZI
MAGTAAALTGAGTSASAPAAVCYLPTSEAYDRWSAVYDTDGNFLQKIDDIEMQKTLLPRLLAELRRRRGIRNPHGQQQQQRGAVVVDLGCGTGRNTALLLSPPATDVVGEVVALDASRGMLDVARERLSSFSSTSSRSSPGGKERAQKPGEEEEEGRTQPPRLHFEHHDLLAAATPPACALGTADAVISTLVVEHVPLRAFFAHAAAMLRPGGGGVLLLTNMHADMGRLSQAGFVDASTGVKVRPTSYAHTVAEVVAEAARWGFRVLEEGPMERGGRGGEGEEGKGGGEWKGDVRGVKEVRVNEDMVEILGTRSRKWVGVTCWFGCLFKMDGGKVE